MEYKMLKGRCIIIKTFLWNHMLGKLMKFILRFSTHAAAESETTTSWYLFFESSRKNIVQEKKNDAYLDEDKYLINY